MTVPWTVNEFETDDGTKGMEYQCGDRTLTILYNSSNGETTEYYVAEAENFKSAGVLIFDVEKLYRIFKWVTGELKTFPTDAVEEGH